VIDLSPALKARVDAILAKLAVLSDAPTQRMSKAPTDRLKTDPGHWGYGGKNKQAFEGNMPPGVRDSRPERFDPDRDTLFDWFVWRLGRCRAEREAEALVLEAEMRHGNVTQRQEPRPHALAGNAETTKTRDKRIARGYPALTPEQVAAIETVRSGQCSPENVRRVRLADDRDPETGHELPREAFLTGDARKKWARERHADGMSSREIARRLRVSDTTVLEWLGRRTRRDRAA
jgi:hypothetical protein